jgi:hypothetical protein
VARRRCALESLRCSPPLDETVVLVLKTWTYQGAGYTGPAAAQLALASAARARDHDQADRAA